MQQLRILKVRRINPRSIDYSSGVADVAVGISAAPFQFYPKAFLDCGIPLFHRFRI